MISWRNCNKQIQDQPQLELQSKEAIFNKIDQLEKDRNKAF